jgi:acetylornithine/succinyldiaminopimelate/putrescine aminotransferase
MRGEEPGTRRIGIMGAQVFRDFRKAYPVIVRGKGVFLYDREGREYLDAVGGISVVDVA